MEKAGKRVVIATRLFTPEVGAGAFRLHALADGLIAHGADVEVVTTKPPRFALPSAKPTNARVSRFPVLRDSGGNVRGYLQYLSFDVPLLMRLLKRRADLVISEPPPTTGLVVSLTSWLRRRPYVYYAADVWSDALAGLPTPKLVKLLMRLVESFVMRHACHVIAVSDGVADRVMALGVLESRISITGNGVDTSVFRNQPEWKKPEHPVFLYTGTMSEWQGPEIFVRAIEKLREEFPHARLEFYGQGAERERLERLVAELGLDSVSFHGVIPPDDTAQRLNSCTAALASIKPGLGYDFARPTKLYAAAACGAPVIFAGVGAGADLVRDQNLGLSSDYETEKVADSMRLVIARSEEFHSEKLRAERSEWVSKHASLDRIGEVAAQAALEAIGGSRG